MSFYDNYKYDEAWGKKQIIKKRSKSIERKVISCHVMWVGIIIISHHIQHRSSIQQCVHGGSTSNMNRLFLSPTNGRSRRDRPRAQHQLGIRMGQLKQSDSTTTLFTFIINSRTARDALHASQFCHPWHMNIASKQQLQGVAFFSF